MSWGDNPKSWLACNRPLSPAEQMYLYALDLPEDTAIVEGEEPKRAKKKAWFEVDVA